MDTDLNHNSGYGVRRLQTVYLHSPFHYLKFLEENRQELEGWNLRTWPSDRLSMLKRNLLWSVPELAPGYKLVRGYPRRRWGSARWKDPVKQCLFLIEELTVTEAAEIYVRDSFY